MSLKNGLGLPNTARCAAWRSTSDWAPGSTTPTAWEPLPFKNVVSFMPLLLFRGEPRLLHHALIHRIGFRRLDAECFRRARRGLVADLLERRAHVRGGERLPHLG